ADDVENVVFLVPPHLARIEDMTLLRRVPQRKLLVEPGGLRVAAQMPERKTVKGRGHDVAVGRQLKHCRDARLHLVGGLPGEGEPQKGRAVDTLLDQMGEAADQRRGLAGAGPRQHQLDVGACGRGTLLGRVETVRGHHFRICNGTAPMRPSRGCAVRPSADEPWRLRLIVTSPFSCKNGSKNCSMDNALFTKLQSPGPPHPGINPLKGFTWQPMVMIGVYSTLL